MKASPLQDPLFLPEKPQLNPLILSVCAVYLLFVWWTTTGSPSHSQQAQRKADATYLPSTQVQ